MRQLMEVFPLSIYAAVSIFIFLGMFCFILFWTYKIESKQSFEVKAGIPLRDEEAYQELRHE